VHNGRIAEFPGFGEELPVPFGTRPSIIMTIGAEGDIVDIIARGETITRPEDGRAVNTAATVLLQDVLRGPHARASTEADSDPDRSSRPSVRSLRRHVSAGRTAFSKDAHASVESILQHLIAADMGLRLPGSNTPPTSTLWRGSLFQDTVMPQDTHWFRR
jgi:hypothetical protein